jgi:hypothetical protein
MRRKTNSKFIPIVLVHVLWCPVTSALIIVAWRGRRWRKRLRILRRQKAEKRSEEKFDEGMEAVENGWRAGGCGVKADVLEFVKLWELFYNDPPSFLSLLPACNLEILWVGCQHVLLLSYSLWFQEFECKFVSFPGARGCRKHTALPFSSQLHGSVVKCWSGSSQHHIWGHCHIPGKALQQCWTTHYYTALRASSGGSGQYVSRVVALATCDNGLHPPRRLQPGIAWLHSRIWPWLRDWCNVYAYDRCKCWGSSPRNLANIL